MEECTRRYVENYPRKVFQRIADHLKPLKVLVLMKWKSVISLLSYSYSLKTKMDTDLVAHLDTSLKFHSICNLVSSVGHWNLKEITGKSYKLNQRRRNPFI